MNDTHSLSHTKWNCKYHVVFAPKYRRKVFYGEKRLEIGSVLRELCKWKGVNLLEAEVCPDHVHMLLEIPPKISISSFMGFLKGKSSLSVLLNAEVLNIECDDGGNYSIDGLRSSGEYSLLFSYDGYCIRNLSLTDGDGYAVANNIIFENRILEDYTNMLNYHSGGSGVITPKAFVSEDVKLGWGHNARFKDIRLEKSATDDFMIQTTITQLDSNEIWAGLSLDTYDANGALKRNISFTYVITPNQERFGISGAGMLSTAMSAKPDGVKCTPFGRQS